MYLAKWTPSIDNRDAMQRSLLITLGLCAMLTACSASGGNNPLTQARQSDELADTLANLTINHDPIMEDATIKALVDKEIATAKKSGDDAREIMEEGMQGALIGWKEDVKGYALFEGNSLYLSSDFESAPGLDVHIYLTSAVDPRDGSFPDVKAVDVGSLRSPYGEQEYTIPSSDHHDKLRTLVLYDKTLKRIFGFAQLSGPAQ